MFLYLLFPLILDANEVPTNREAFQVILELKQVGDRWVLERSDRCEGNVQNKDRWEDAFFFADTEFSRFDRGFSAQVNGEPVDGKCFETGKPDFEDVFINDFNLTLLHFGPNLKNGDDFSWQAKGSMDPALTPRFFIPNRPSEGTYALSVIHPEDVQVEFDWAHSFQPLHFETSAEGGRTTLRLDQRPYHAPLAHHPFNPFLGVITLSLRRGEEILTHANAEEFNHWYMLKIQQLEHLSEKNETMVRTMVAAETIDRAKLETLSRWFQAKFRYVQQMVVNHTIFPHEPDVVIEKGYADCKDRALTLKAMANRTGIQVHLVLVSSEPQLTTRHVSAGQFDHMMCAWKEGDHWVFFDPTQPFYRFGSIPGPLRGKRALILGTSPEWAIIPEMHPNAPELELELTCHADQPDLAQAVVYLSGDLQAAALEWLAKGTPLDFENALAEMLGSSLRGIGLDYFQLVEPGDSRMKLKAQADLSQWIIASRKNVYIPKTICGFLTNSWLDRTEDQTDLFLPPMPNIRFSLTLTQTNLTTEPGTFQMGDPVQGFGYSGKLEIDQGIPTFEYHFFQGKSHWEAGNKALFLDTVKQMFALQKDLFVLKRNL